MDKLDKEDEETDRKTQEAIMKMAEEGIMHPTVQQIHDFQMPDRIKPDPGSRERLEALLKRKEQSSEVESPYDGRDLYARLKAENPGLTDDEIDEEARAFGF